MIRSGTISLCVLYAALSVRAQESAPDAVPSHPVAPPSPAPRLNIDVFVTDTAGKPASALEPPDFSIFDNDQVRKVMNFRRTDALAGSRFDPPVELIIVLDAVNVNYQAVTLQRVELEKFLRENDGKLALPTSVFIFSSKGLQIQPQPSKDGKATAAVLDQATGTVRARDLSGGVYSLQEQFNDSFKTIKGIAENETSKRGRKVLVWIGPGWPLLTERYFIQTNESRRHYFEELENLTNKLREARITIYNVAPVVGITRELYKEFLKPVTDPRKMEIGYLGLQVLAVRTGGRVLDPANDLAHLIDQCVADIGTYYTLTFEEPATTPGQYHNLRVQVSGEGLKARTTSGYYSRP